MNLDMIWDLFLSFLSSHKEIKNASSRKIAGIPFLFIELDEGCIQNQAEHLIRVCSGKAMRGKQLHSETEFVRSEPPLFIYRHRFLVPQQKMFCCGNLCEDCIRLKPNRYWK